MSFEKEPSNLSSKKCVVGMVKIINLTTFRIMLHLAQLMRKPSSYAKHASLGEAILEHNFCKFCTLACLDKLSRDKTFDFPITNVRA